MVDTRTRILEASEELFRRQGLTGTGIKQILAQAEAPFGSLYHHFPGGKDELAAETIRRAGVHYAVVVLEALNEHTDPADAVRAAFEGAAQTLVDTDYADACPVETVALEVACTNEPLRKATAEVFQSWIDGLASWLEQHGVEPCGAAGLAVVILSALEGAFVLARSTRSTDPLTKCGHAMASLIDSPEHRR
jgi:AcrR family transcriptional regulator